MTTRRVRPLRDTREESERHILVAYAYMQVVVDRARVSDANRVRLAECCERAHQAMRDAMAVINGDDET